MGANVQAAPGKDSTAKMPLLEAHTGGALGDMICMHDQHLNSITLTCMHVCADHAKCVDQASTIARGRHSTVVVRSPHDILHCQISYQVS